LKAGAQPPGDRERRALFSIRKIRSKTDCRAVGLSRFVFCNATLKAFRPDEAAAPLQLDGAIRRGRLEDMRFVQTALKALLQG